MFKKTILAVTLMAASLSALANWSAGAGYAKMSEDDVSLGLVYGSVSYEFAKEGSKFSFAPELRLGTGISDDEVFGMKVEINSFTALSVRGQYNHDNGVYVYAMPSYANVDMKATFNGQSYSDDEWELGFGAGIGKKLNDKASIEASYETYDGVDVLAVGFKYAF